MYTLNSRLGYGGKSASNILVRVFCTVEVHNICKAQAEPKKYKRGCACGEGYSKNGENKCTGNT